MPTRAELPSKAGHLGIPYFPREASRSWTDDLPVCRLSGVGLSTNQVYREDGQRQEDHECEDRSFHFRLNDDTYFYGVFDGHEGQRAADFAAQRMPAEVLLGQLDSPRTDKEVKEILHHAFNAVEKGYFESIDDLLAERVNLQVDMPEHHRNELLRYKLDLSLQGLTEFETYQKHPELMDKLHQITSEISSGTTAVVALVYNDRLYVANVGDSRALLCRQEETGLRVIQLSVDHDCKNEDELLRLSLLGVNTDAIHSVRNLGNQSNTRCLGNYLIKVEFKEFDIFKDATGDPVIAEPEVHGGLVIEDSFGFFILMSDGLYKAYEEATGSLQANSDIASMVAEQFAEQSTITGVAQAVVDKVVRLHHDCYMSTRGSVSKRDDITLLVRRFGSQLTSKSSSSGSSGSTTATSPLPPFHPPTDIENMRYVIPANDLNFYHTVSSSSQNESTAEQSPEKDIPGLATPTAESSSVTSTSSTEPQTTSANNQTPSSGTTTTSADSDQRPFSKRGRMRVFELDENGRIEPYVDFSNYYNAVQDNPTLMSGIETGGKK